MVYKVAAHRDGGKREREGGGIRGSERRQRQRGRQTRKTDKFMQASHNQQTQARKLPNFSALPACVKQQDTRT